MEKPHYKQPITADNIETALQFYLERNPDIKYKRDAGKKNEFENIDNHIREKCPELKSMHDIEQLLEEYLPLISKLPFKKSDLKRFVPPRAFILDTILNATSPQYRSGQGRTVWHDRLINGLNGLRKKQLRNQLSTTKITQITK